MGELFSIPGPNDCIVTCCGELLTVLWFYAEQFFFQPMFGVADLDLGELFSIPGLPVAQQHTIYLSICLSVVVSKICWTSGKHSRT